MADHTHSEILFWAGIACVLAIAVAWCIGVFGFGFNSRLDYHRDFICSEFKDSANLPDDCPDSPSKKGIGERLDAIEKRLGDAP